ncbi:MAG TPA: hypothetical protein VJY42_04625, partial [Candidatus Methanomethylophilaceae archaeon]|nr:hypothetical protein [Candidatus Methanomethylophilaceae archaeon]
DKMSYRVDIISTEKVRELRDKYSNRNFFTSKADISGVCFQLYTENRKYIEMWTENFFSMSDRVRSHARAYEVTDPDEDSHVDYDPYSSTVFIYNFDYYGWVKSIALGVTGNLLEDVHNIHSIHGAAIDIDGAGVTLIAPSKTGKTTQSWGLLRMPNARLISDDWYFVVLGNGRPDALASERNCYIDADIGDVWEEYKPLVACTEFDNKGRCVANIRWVHGESAVMPSTSIRTVIFLKRDYDDARLDTELSSEEAIEYMTEHDLCNPHQMIRTKEKMKLRMEFLKKYFDECRMFLVNTTTPAEETQERIRKLIALCRS